MPPYAFPVTTPAEFAAGILEAGVTLGIAGLSMHLAWRHRRAYFGWWAAAWVLYLGRIGCILLFLRSEGWGWLYWHQVATGWTALALLWSAMAFSRSFTWRWWHAAFAAFPPLWSYIAIYAMNDFFWAALPMVLFLSFATIWTGLVFLAYRRRIGRSAGATVLAATFMLWGLHHLDYPVLRARGAWSPWGYYVDVLFLMFAGAGILLLVLDELRRGLSALLALSSELQRAGGDRIEALLQRPLSLPGVRGSALVRPAEDAAPEVVRGAGSCAAWAGKELHGAGARAVGEALRTRHPVVTNEWRGEGQRRAGYVAVLPIFSGERANGAILIAGEARDPFAVLDADYLVALGRQVGAALDYGALTARLEARTGELERLSARMVRLHEDERRRLSRELHDETAQMLSALKMQLGLMREQAGPADAADFDRALAMLDRGIRSIRNLTNDLRPSLLDDVGLVPALRSLVTEFAERSGVPVEVSAPEELPRLSTDAELALFRALQEALANVARHAHAHAVRVAVAAPAGEVALTVADDGRGLGDVDLDRLERDGHMGLVGMRERLAILGGTLRIDGAGRGTRIEIRVPGALKEQLQ